MGGGRRKTRRWAIPRPFFNIIKSARGEAQNQRKQSKSDRFRGTDRRFQNCTRAFRLGFLIGSVEPTIGSRLEMIREQRKSTQTRPVPWSRSSVPEMECANRAGFLIGSVEPTIGARFKVFFNAHGLRPQIRGNKANAIGSVELGIPYRFRGTDHRLQDEHDKKTVETNAKAACSVEPTVASRSGHA